MFNPDQEFSPFKKHKEIEADTVDKGTKDIYNSQRFFYNFVKHRISDMSPVMQKHFKDIGEFLEGYEANIIKHWQEFYRTKEEIMKGIEK